MHTNACTLTHLRTLAGVTDFTLAVAEKRLKALSISLKAEINAIMAADNSGDEEVCMAGNKSVFFFKDISITLKAEINAIMAADHSGDEEVCMAGKR